MILVLMQTQVYMERVPTTSAEPSSALWLTPVHHPPTSVLRAGNWELVAEAAALRSHIGARPGSHGTASSRVWGAEASFLFSSSLDRQDRSGNRGSTGGASPDASAPAHSSQ